MVYPRIVTITEYPDSGWECFACGQFSFFQFELEFDVYDAFIYDKLRREYLKRPAGGKIMGVGRGTVRSSSPERNYIDVMAAACWMHGRTLGQHEMLLDFVWRLTA